MEWIKETFGTEKPVIAMCHFAEMPGDPYFDAEGGMEKVVDGNEWSINTDPVETEVIENDYEFSSIEATGDADFVIVGSRYYDEALDDADISNIKAKAGKVVVIYDKSKDAPEVRTDGSKLVIDAGKGDDSIHFTIQSDNFSHRNVTRVAKPKDTSGSRGSSGGGGGDSAFTYKLLLIAVAVTFLLPIFISTFATVDDSDPRTEELLGEALEGYNRFTGGEQALTNESVWILNGIYRPYLGQGGNYLYTPDGWLAGEVVYNYEPSQYVGNEYYKVVRNSENYYQYTGTTYDGHSSGDMYTSVSMDVNEKSNIFFTTNNKVSEGSYFYYQYSGLRYAFVPLTSTYSYDGDGNLIEAQRLRQRPWWHRKGPSASCWSLRASRGAYGPLPRYC